MLISVAALGAAFYVYKSLRKTTRTNEVYAIYAGHEISKALAKNEVTTQFLDNFDMSDLKASEGDHLTSMIEHFEMKYVCVGTLQEWQN